MTTPDVPDVPEVTDATGVTGATASADPPAAPAAPEAPGTSSASDGAEAGGAADRRLVPVEVVNVDFHLASPSPVLQLRESDPPYRVCAFPIGVPEAQAIALALEREHAPRPTTAELLASVAAAAGAELVALHLTGTTRGTVLAELHLSTPRGSAVVDCRPSDGVALALRQPGGAPILCEEGLLEA